MAEYLISNEMAQQIYNAINSKYENGVGQISGSQFAEKIEGIQAGSTEAPVYPINVVVSDGLRGYMTINTIRILTPSEFAVAIKNNQTMYIIVQPS